MAYLSEILSRRWPGNGCTFLEENDYDSMIWPTENPDPKPTLAEILAYNDEVDAEIALETLRYTQQDVFNINGRPDRVLTSLQALLTAVVDLRAKAQVNEPLDTGADAALDDLAQAIAFARAQQP